MKRLILVIAALLSSCGPVFEPAGPVSVQPHLAGNALVVRDGAHLPLRRWSPSGQPKGAVIALHGFTDYSAAFEQLGPWFADQGFETFAYDQRGFGAAPHPGIWPGSEALVGDLVDAIAVVRGTMRGADLPLYLLGESMGGSVAIATAATRHGHGLDGLILAAPGLRNELPYRPLWDALFWTAAHLAPGFDVSVDADSDRELVPASEARLRNDPLVIRDIRADTYYGVVQLADRASHAARKVETPTLMLYGGEDGLIRHVSICAAYQLMPAPATLRFYPEAPHLLLHWQRRDHVLDDVSRWLDGNREAAGSTGGCMGS